MKKYKEYMDRIGLSEEKHQQILKAMAREEAEQTREDASGSQSEPLPPVAVRPWYKRPAVLRWSSMAAVCCLLLLVGISAVTRNNRIALPVTTAAVNSLSNTTLAVNATLTPTLAPEATMATSPAPEATMATSLAPAATMAPTTLTPTGAAIPTLAPTGGMTPTLAPYHESGTFLPPPLFFSQFTEKGEELCMIQTEDSFIISELLGGISVIHAGSFSGKTESVQSVPELNAYFERIIPDADYSSEDVFIRIENDYYRFIPKKADADIRAAYEALLIKYGFKAPPKK